MQFVKNQLVGKDTIYAGDPKFQKEKRTFVVLSYDTADGQYTAVWDKWINELKGAGVDVKGHVSYFLNLPTVQADAQTIVQKLKAIDATTVIFTGDPIAPIYFTTEATKQKYFPEWVMSGTVFADTAVFRPQVRPDAVEARIRTVADPAAHPDHAAGLLRGLHGLRRLGRAVGVQHAGHHLRQRAAVVRRARAGRATSVGAELLRRHHELPVAPA